MESRFGLSPGAPCLLRAYLFKAATIDRLRHRRVEHQGPSTTGAV